MAKQQKKVVVIGGGVAGISAACALADAGLHVELFEKRPLLGGRASSYIDPQTGERVDECQHGTMRCCTSLAALLERLGVHDKIRYFDAIEFLDGEGKRSVIKGCGLPAPAHTSLSFLQFRSLGLRDKIGIARAMSAMLHVRADPKYDALDIGTWFARAGQSERAIARFWRPILVSACNEELDRISCTHAFKIFRDGFLSNATGFHFGVATVPLGTLYTEPTVAYLKTRGSCVRTRTIVDKIHFSGGANGHVTGVSLLDEETITADYYVSALQCDLLLKLLPPDVTDGVAYWENIRGIELSPIIGVHLWFDRRFDCPPALATLDRTTEWIFNKTAIYETRHETDNAGSAENSKAPEPQFADAAVRHGTYLSMVISASYRLSKMPKEELVALVLAEVQDCVPGARSASLVRSQVVKWPKATISPKPGVDALRPDQRSPITNFYVAGEWTQTGWPSTMEGAAHSGFRAAEYILEREGSPKTLIAPDLPRALVSRLLMGNK